MPAFAIVAMRIVVVVVVLILVVPLLIALLFFPLPKKLHHFDAYLILGCAPTKQNTMSKMMQSRVDELLTQYQFCPRPIVFSGGVPYSKTSEAGLMATYALAKGVKPEHLIREEHSRNTYENFLFSTNILKSHEFKKICVISNGFHLRRANFFATKFGLDAMFVGATLRGYVPMGYQMALLVWEMMVRTKCMLIEWRLWSKGNPVHPNNSNSIPR